VLNHALVLFLVFGAGCISRAKEAIAPEPQGVGTLSCREIVEQCDAQCGDPLCVNRCTGEGTEQGQGQHAALLECGQQHGCTDQQCMETSCPNEISACMGPNTGAPADSGSAAPEQQSPGAAPGQMVPPPATPPSTQPPSGA
jgi:hypothetical protein